MKEHPIIFSAPMVRAILEGRKTQTRRIVKTQPANGWEFDGTYGRITSKHPKRGKFGAFIRRGVGTDFPEWDLIPHRYGAPGDRLWVKETFAEVGTLDPGFIVYRADYPECVPDGLENIPSASAIKWKPSIHMPRSASRMTLEITNIRAARLNEISEEDARAEGGEWRAGDACSFGWRHDGENGFVHGSARESFRQLWESINGDDSWDANPWVWVIEFQQLPNSLQPKPLSASCS